MKQTTILLPSAAREMLIESEGTKYKVAIAILETQRPEHAPDCLFFDLRSIDGTALGPDQIILLRVPMKLLAIVMREALKIA